MASAIRRRAGAIGMALALAIALGGNGLRAAADEFGNTLYKSQHGAPDGYPGVFPGTKEATDKVTGEKTTVALYPKWGFPELENYPGSVEHYRQYQIKYKPAINPFDAKTLVKNFVLAQRPGLTCEDYAEPIYYVPMYANPTFTGKHRAPVKVFRLKRDGSNAIGLDLGKLGRGMYAVRLIGAMPGEPTDGTEDPPPMVLTCSVNSGRDGASEVWTRRVRPVDEFYGVGAWYFHATDDRAFRVELRLEPESTRDLVVYNVDLHNPLAACPEQIIKRAATLYPAEARQAAQDYYEKTGKTLSNWGPNIGLPTKKGLWQDAPVSGEERVKRDETLWNLPPPAAMNLHNTRIYGKYDNFTPDAQEQETIGTWAAPFSTLYGRNWDKLRLLENKKLGLSYTMADYLQRLPLPDPYPYKDRGWGVKVAGKGYFSPVLEGMTYTAAYQLIGHEIVGTLPCEYYNRNNLDAARDAAFLLCRIAYTLPADSLQQKNSLQQVTCRAEQCFGFADPLNRRYTGVYGARGLTNLARVYDILFDYLKDNQELATAVGRFVPWIKTPADLRAYLDQRLLQYAMRELETHRMGTSHETPRMAILIATVAQDREATRPLMERTFTATWDYPLPLSGVQDYMVTGTTRDGTTTIGSFSYTAGGSPFLNVADEIGAYIRNGGDPKYNLADRARYPKPFEAAYFNLDARVAGLWPLGVGDVGGTMKYGHWFENQATAVRSGLRYLKDPKLAFILQHFFGRTDETDAEWAEVERLAQAQVRNPWLENRSRVLSAWAGILEGGTQHDDYRFRRAATVRVGLGWGHSHRDTLDLQVFGLGCQMSPDGGQRPGYGRPDCPMTMNHNVVEVDGNASKGVGDWEGHAWVRQMSDLPGSHFLHAEATPPTNKQQVRYFGRSVALLDVDEGQAGTTPPSDARHGLATTYAKDAVLPRSYVFDVSRVAGGKRHTYGFHGCPEDEFTVNAVNPVAVPLPGQAEGQGNPDVQYLRRYILAGCQGAGAAPDTVVATWRLGREPFSFTAKGGGIDEGKEKTFKCAAPEQLMLGSNYAPEAPRKYTRLHLLGQAGARCLWGKWVSAAEGGTVGQWFTQLHVMQDGPEDREAVFPAVIEMYAGEPAIQATKLLTIADNERDAQRAVAVAVTTTNGHADVLFDDGRPGQARRVALPGGQALAVNARYAYVSTDAAGLRQAALSHGSLLDLPGVVRMQPRQAEYRGTIGAVDHLTRGLDVATAVPPALVGTSFWDVGNEQHRTSLDVTSVAAGKEGGSRLTFRKGLELVCTRVMALDAAQGVVTGKLVSIEMGADEDNGMKPGMTNGLRASNEAMTKWWHCQYLGGSRDEGYRYQLTGAPVTPADFPINGAIRIWEIGPGDTAALATYAGLRRLPAGDGVYEITANVPFTLALPVAQFPGALEVSPDQQVWRPVPATIEQGQTVIVFTEAVLGTGRLFLRAGKPAPAGKP